TGRGRPPGPVARGGRRPPGWWSGRRWSSPSMAPPLGRDGWASPAAIILRWFGPPKSVSGRNRRARAGRARQSRDPCRKVLVEGHHPAYSPVLNREHAASAADRPCRDPGVGVPVVRVTRPRIPPQKGSTMQTRRSLFLSLAAGLMALSVVVLPALADELFG